MRRSVVESLTAAPVVGFSPFGLKNAPLRNMRLAHSLHHKHLLRDGLCSVYRVRPRQDRRKWPIPMVFWTMTTWLAYSGIITGLILHPGLTWIGITNATIFVAWSIIVRLLDRYCTEPASLQLRPDNDDAVFILGRRNSCFILEGCNKDIAKWTGRGIRQKEGRVVEFLVYLMRLGSLAVILFVFITIPNGTTWDQVAFIAVNIIGQLNVLIGQKLAASRCFSELEEKETCPVPSRTHVYAVLLRRFGSGEWVDVASLLPQTTAWKKWRELCCSYDSWDAKELYYHCVKLQEGEEGSSSA